MFMKPALMERAKLGLIAKVEEEATLLQLAVPAVETLATLATPDFAQPGAGPSKDDFFSTMKKIRLSKEAQVGAIIDTEYFLLSPQLILIFRLDILKPACPQVGISKIELTAQAVVEDLLDRPTEEFRNLRFVSS